MIAQLVSVWKSVLTHPSVQTFDEQKSSATRERTITSVVIAGIVSAILSFILTLAVTSFFAGVATGINGVPVAGVTGPTAAFKSLIVTLIQTLAGFYIFCYALQYTASHFFGGRGNLDEQAYLISTYWAPISILGAILVFIPCLGWIAALLLGIYALVLTTYAVQSEQGLAIGTAVINWIVAGIVTAVILFLLGLVSGGWL